MHFLRDQWLVLCSMAGRIAFQEIWLMRFNLATVVLTCLPLTAEAQGLPAFDWLDAAAIPGEESFEGQPKELVAILGTNRGRLWEPIFSLANSPDGKYLACGAEYSRIGIYHAATLRVHAQIRGHRQPVVAVAFSLDSKMLASASGVGNTGAGRAFVKGDVKVWDVETGKQLADLGEHTDLVHAVAFAPDGRHLATASNNNTLRLWDLSKNPPQSQAPIRAPSATAVTFTPDGKAVVVGDKLGQMRCWDAATGRALGTYPGHDSGIHTLVFLREGKVLLSCGVDGVRIWDWNAGKPVERPQLNELKKAWPVALSHDEKRLAAVVDNTICIWDMKLGRPQFACKVDILGHAVRQVTLSPNGDTISVIQVKSNALRQWAVRGAVPKERQLPAGPEHQLLAMAWSTDGRQIVAAGYEDRAWLWEWNGKSFNDGITWPLQEWNVEALALTPDGTMLATGQERLVKLWDLRVRPPKLVRAIEDKRPTDQFFFWSWLAFAPDGKVLATCNRAGSPGVLDINGEEPKYRYWLPEGALSAGAISFSPDGKTLAIAVRFDSVWLWNITKREKMRLPIAGGEVGQLLFSPDGHTLAIGMHNGHVILWEVVAGKERASLVAKGGAINGLAFSPSGTRLAVAASVGEVTVWAWGQKQWSVRMPGSVSGVAWAPDGRHLATANANGTVYILRVPDGE
jgi:WD40 repeat protein